MTGSPLQRAYTWLEPDEGKLSCPVLRGGSVSNDALLPDFDGLSAKVQTVLNSSRSRVTSSFSEDAEATSSSFCGGTEMACVCLPSVLNEDDLSGRRPPKVRFA